MDPEMQSTDNATLALLEVLSKLEDHLLDHHDTLGLEMVNKAKRFIDGRSLVMSELNGALAAGIAFGAMIIPEHPTDEHRQDYRDLIRLAEHVS